MKRILVVEDDAPSAAMVRDLLESQGYEVLTAEDGPAGIHQWRLEHPDLLLIDVMLPVRTGFEVCREVKASEEGRRTPVILMSAYYTHPERDPKYGRVILGADAYLIKPFEMSRLLGHVKALIGEA